MAEAQAYALFLHITTKMVKDKLPQPNVYLSSYHFFLSLLKFTITLLVEEPIIVSGNIQL